MSLIFTDSFSHYATADIPKKYGANAGASIVAGSGRRGAGCLNLNISATAYAARTLATPSATVIQGGAVRSSGGSDYGTGGTIFTLSEGATAHLSLCLNSSTMRLEVRRGTSAGTVIATSASAITWPILNYAHFEWKATIHDTTGAVAVRFNGQEVINVTGVDTRNAGTTGLIDTVTFGASSGTSLSSGIGLRLSDYTICDEAGSTNNDFLGDVRVDCYFPTSDGANTGLTPSTGTSHFALVDESTPNTTDYNSSDVVGTKDTYGMADMAHSPSAILGVAVVAGVLKDDAGARSMKTIARSGGTDYLGNELALSTSLAFLTTIRETDPATSAAWTKAGLNAAEFGAQVSA